MATETAGAVVACRKRCGKPRGPGVDKWGQPNALCEGCYNNRAMCSKCGNKRIGVKPGGQMLPTCWDYACRLCDVCAAEGATPRAKTAALDGRGLCRKHLRAAANADTAAQPCGQCGATDAPMNAAGYCVDWRGCLARCGIPMD